MAKGEPSQEGEEATAACRVVVVHHSLFFIELYVIVIELYTIITIMLAPNHYHAST